MFELRWFWKHFLIEGLGNFGEDKPFCQHLLVLLIHGKKRVIISFTELHCNMMVVDLLTSGPTTTAISQIIDTIGEFICYASDVLVQKNSFQELASYLERITPILKELRKEKVSDSETFNRAIDIINHETKDAKLLALECSKKSKVYLLMKCQSIVKRLENHVKELSKALELLPLAASGLSVGILEEIEKLCDNMEANGFKAAVIEEEILEKIESGIRENNCNRSYANNLIILIAETLGITKENSTMKKELEEFKKDIENSRVNKELAEVMHMDQIIALLERADATSSPNERKIKYFAKRKSLGSRILEPLQSFYCPITHDVMVEPVETSSDQTFERSAIEKWFAEGNKLCPMTLIPLDTSVLRPNKTLKQSIEEWKDRNTMITIATLKEKIQFGDDDNEVMHCLKTLQDLCEQKEQHKEWVILEDYMQVLIQILGSKNRDVRIRALSTLCILANDNEEAKVYK